MNTHTHVDKEFNVAIPLEGGIGTQVNDDKSLHVSFYDEKILDQEKTRDENREIYKTVTMIKTFVSKKHIDIRPAILEDVRVEGVVREYSDVKRFPNQWNAYKNGTEDLYGGGYPMESWVQMPKNLSDLLKINHKIYSIEQFIAYPSSKIINIPDVESYKKKAQYFLNASNNNAVFLQQQNEMDALKTQMKELQDMLKKQAEQPDMLKADISEDTDTQQKTEQKFDDAPVHGVNNKNQKKHK